MNHISNKFTVLSLCAGGALWGYNCSHSANRADWNLLAGTLAQENFFELFPSFFCLQHVTTVNFHFVRPDEVNSKLYVYMQIIFVLFPGHSWLFIYKYTLSPRRTWGTSYFRQISMCSGAADIFNTIFRRFLNWGRGGVWNNCWWGTSLFIGRPERWDSIGNFEVTDSTGGCITVSFSKVAFPSLSEMAMTAAEMPTFTTSNWWEKLPQKALFFGSEKEYQTQGSSAFGKTNPIFNFRFLFNNVKRQSNEAR